MGFFGRKDIDSSVEAYKRGEKSLEFFKSVDWVYVGSIQETEDRLKQIIQNNREEGEVLNKEYEVLKTNAQKAMEALKDFQKEKLGMDVKK